MQLFLENSIEIMGLLMQKITNLIICVLYISVIFLFLWNHVLVINLTK